MYDSTDKFSYILHKGSGVSEFLKQGKKRKWPKSLPTSLKTTTNALWKWVRHGNQT